MKVLNNYVNYTTRVQRNKTDLRINSKLGHHIKRVITVLEYKNSFGIKRDLGMVSRKSIETSPNV